jgi:hypothetical protein
MQIKPPRDGRKPGGGNGAAQKLTFAAHAVEFSKILSLQVTLQVLSSALF